MRNNVSDIYRYPFSSFKSDLYPAPGSRSYIFRRTAVRNKQQATTLLQVTPLILPISTSRSSLCNGKPELEARFLRGEPIKRPARTPHRASRNRDPVLSREEQYCRAYLAVRLTVTRSYYSKANLSVSLSYARVHLFVPLIYLIHSRFYLAPRTCVNSCTLWNNQRRDWATYLGTYDSTVLT